MSFEFDPFPFEAPSLLDELCHSAQLQSTESAPEKAMWYTFVNLCLQKKAMDAK